MAEQAVRGRCLCGDIRYEYRGDPILTVHCHCESCRRHTSAPVATFVCVPRTSFRLISGTPTVYVSSPGARRSHCGRCGSPISYEGDRHPEQIELYIGTLEDPAAARPTCHIYTAEQLPWFEAADTLPRYEHGRRGATPVRHGPGA
jgi:hypothetical protein